MKRKICFILICLLASLTFASAQEMYFPSGNHCMYRVAHDRGCLLLPVEEKAEISHVRIIADGGIELKKLNVRLAFNHVDYYVPLYLDEFTGRKGLTLDIHVHGSYRNDGEIQSFACWKHLTYADGFDMSNREKYRPLYHHTPAYGWMNDPNGMFYKDGKWHLYFQHNPFGSQWENMTWGHSVSEDLVNWTFEGDPVVPDAYGTVFSGSAVVDHNNTAGFGAGAVVAMYTAAGENQTQCLAYSTDDGRTFTKYSGNPVIIGNVPDFRDPHMFWNEDTGKWNMILAAGQQMNIYSSGDLKNWKYESSFGQGYGCHGGVWECPDLMKMKVRGTDKEKWMLICNINPGGPFGGSATQYFVGDFDGHEFVCESAPETTKWMDYGKDHYATVTFDNAPDGRRVALAWMSNWQYAGQVPTMQYRSGNSIPRDLGLFEYGGETYCSVVPSEELLALRSAKPVSRLTSACEIVVHLQKDTVIKLYNGKGERIVLTYDETENTFSMDRTRSGVTDFSETFPAVTIAPTYGKISELRIFVDNGSIEIFDAEGKMAMSNLVFPTEPYDRISFSRKTKYTIYDLSK